MAKRRVVVTGLGMVTPCGTGVRESWDAIVGGESGVAPITLFDPSMMETRFAGEVKGFVPENYMARKQARRIDRYQQFAMAAAEMAMTDSAYAPSADTAARSA